MEPGGEEKSRRIEFSHGKWSTRGTKTAKSVLPYVQVPGELVRIFFVHYCCCGSHFPEGHLGITEECTNLEFSYTYGRFLLDFSIRRVPTTLGCESHSQAGLASPHHQLPRVVSFSRIIIDMLQSYMIWLVSVRSQEFLGVKAFRSPLQW